MEANRCYAIFTWVFCVTAVWRGWWLTCVSRQVWSARATHLPDRCLGFSFTCELCVKGVTWRRWKVKAFCSCLSSLCIGGWWKEKNRRLLRWDATRNPPHSHLPRVVSAQEETLASVLELQSFHYRLNRKHRVNSMHFRIKRKKL